MYQWSEEHQCWCDIGGLPVPKRVVRHMMALCKQHLRRSEIQLAKSHNEVLHRQYPEMLEQHELHAEDMQ